MCRIWKVHEKRQLAKVKGTAIDEVASLVSRSKHEVNGNSYKGRCYGEGMDPFQNYIISRWLPVGSAMSGNECDGHYSSVFPKLAV